MDPAGEGAVAGSRRHGRTARTVALAPAGAARQASAPAEALFAGEGESAGAQGQLFQAQFEEERQESRVRARQSAFASDVGAQRYAEQGGVLRLGYRRRVHCAFA